MTDHQSTSWVPKPILRFCSKFPLVVLPAEDEDLSEKLDCPELWIHPPWQSSDWASRDPTCLRLQLLMLFRNVNVRFRSWEYEASAPDGALPALRLPNNDLLPASEIRAWLDKNHPLPEDSKTLNGMPTEDAHTKALAFAHIVLQKVHPAYMTTISPLDTTLYLPYQQSLHLPSSIYNALPNAIKEVTKATKFSDRLIIHAGVEGVKTLGGLCREHVRGGGWFLDAETTSPLDALIASHIYPINFLPRTSPLVAALDEQPELQEYVRRVLDEAATRI